MSQISQYRERVRFDRRGLDDNDDRAGPWGPITTVWARIQPLKGSETVLEQRLQGVQPFVIYVRASSVTRAIDNSYRAVDARDASRVFDITAPPILTEDRREVQILATLKAGQSKQS